MKRKVWFLIVCLCAFGMAVTPADAAAETETAVDEAGMNVVIAVDTSKSMMEIPFDSPDMNIVRSTLLLYDLIAEIPGAAVKYSLFSSSVMDPQLTHSYPHDDDLNLTDDVFKRLDEPGVITKKYMIETYEAKADRFTALSPGLQEVRDAILDDKRQNTDKEYALVLISDFQTEEPARQDAVGYAKDLKENGVLVLVISPQGPEQKRDDDFKSTFCKDAGVPKGLDTDNEQELSKAYIDTFIQLASCYAHYQPVFIAPQAFTYREEDMGRGLTDNGTADAANTKNRSGYAEDTQDEAGMDAGDEDPQTSLRQNQYQYKHPYTPILDADLLIIMNFYDHQIEKMVMQRYADDRAEYPVAGLRHYILRHQVDLTETADQNRGKLLYTYWLIENERLDTAQSEENPPADPGPELNPDIYILEKLPVNLIANVKQNGITYDRTLSQHIPEDSCVAQAIAADKDRPDDAVYMVSRRQALAFSFFCDKEKERRASGNRVLHIRISETGNEKDDAESGRSFILKPDESGIFQYEMPRELIAGFAEKEYTFELEMFETDGKGNVGDQISSKTFYLIFEQNSPYFARDFGGAYPFIKQSVSKGELTVHFEDKEVIYYRLEDIIEDDQDERYDLKIEKIESEFLSFDLAGKYLTIEKSGGYWKTFFLRRSSRNVLGKITLKAIDEDENSRTLTLKVFEEPKENERKTD